MKNQPSRLCLILSGKNLQENVNCYEKNKYLIDLVEIRADYLKESELNLLPRFPSFFDCPTILTLRRQTDGGLFTGPDNERLALFEKCLEGGYRFFDLEIDLGQTKLEDQAQRKGIKLIRSLHDFKGLPNDLAKIVKRVPLKQIPKVAVQPQSISQLNELIELSFKIKHRTKIILAMGNFGTPTRILAAKLGSYLSYCSATDQALAPGQLSLKKLTYLYRFKELNRKTKIFAIIGNPIAHSFSPYLHNKSFRNLRLDAVYIPFLVDKVEDFFYTAKLLNIQGFSVTVPHKSSVIPFLKHKEPLVDAVGACNTVVRRGNHFFGTNTDVAGFLKPLANYFSDNDYANLKACVIGAGGAARAVLYALKSKGVKEVLILNRTIEKAKMLAQEYGFDWGPLAQGGFSRLKNYRQLIVQTTDVGMAPESEADPLSGYEFNGDEIVYDLIYNPRLTKVLTRALEAGCKVINGEEMLFAQADLQFKIFTSKESTFKNCFLIDLLNDE